MMELEQINQSVKVNIGRYFLPQRCKYRCFASTIKTVQVTFIKYSTVCNKCFVVCVSFFASSVAVRKL